MHKCKDRGRRRGELKRTGNEVVMELMFRRGCSVEDVYYTTFCFARYRKWRIEENNLSVYIHKWKLTGRL